MAIPDYQTLMLPVLRFAADGEEHHFQDAVETLAEEFALSKDERSELLPSGGQPLFTNRVGWARSYLKQAGLLKSTRRGYFAITEAGSALLKEGLNSIDIKVLDRYPSFQEFRNRSRKKSDDDNHKTSVTTFPASSTPEDSLASAYKELRDGVEEEVLSSVKESSPAFFERLVVDLLVRMGYGGSRQDAGRAIGRSGDEGIDGIINEDRLGLDVIYLQAKRWEAVVGRPEIQKFAGAIQGKRAKKGVFITTSSFSREAIDYANAIDSKIILIDGERLSKLMVEFNVGVSVAGSYEVKKLDSDYFDNE